MSIFTAIANFKIAFLEALIGTIHLNQAMSKPSGSCWVMATASTRTVLIQAARGTRMLNLAKPIDSTPHPQQDHRASRVRQASVFIESLSA